MKGVDMRKRLSGITLSLVLQIALAHLSLITAQGINEYPPEMLEHPAAGQTPIEATSKRLTCSARAIPSPVYSWFHDGQPIDGYQNLTTGVLGLHNLTQSDNGEYRCMARNRLGAELSAAAVIKVAALRPFTQFGPQEVVVDQGKAIVLALPTIDRLALDLSWEQNNLTLQEYDIFHRITINFSLVLLSVDMNLNGKEYRVKAEYFFAGFESKSSPYNIRVRDNSTDASNPTNMPPEVIVAPVDTYATLGDENVHLECIINARPMSMLTLNWYRVNQNGTRTLLEHENSKYLLTPYKRRLIIREIVESDSGRYQCEGILNVPGISGSFTPATAAANLTVRVPPLLSTVTKTLERDFSQTATLECQADGVPRPTRQWFFNGRDIAAVLSNRHTLHANGTLVIRNLDLPDAGKYQCFARNVVGETYQAIWLKVNSAPPQIVKAPENLTIVELSDARFFCQVTGAPSPQITWKKVVNGIEQPVVIGGRFQVFPDSLLIATVEKADSGVYKCTATNIKGTQSAQAQLVVITKTQIIRPPQNQTVILSTLVRFECGISRDDNTVPVWEWFFYKNGDLSLQQQLTSTGRYQITNEGTLSISGVAAQDIGLYKCHVISAGGNDSRIATLKVIAAADVVTTAQPTRHHDVTCLDNRMSFSIPIPGNLPRTAILSDPRCHVDTAGGNLMGSINLNSCGTTVAFTNDSVIFRNVITVTSADNSTGEEGLIPIQCKYDRFATVQLSYMPVVRHVLFTEVGIGQLSFRIQQFMDARYLTAVADSQYPLRMEPNERVYIQLSLGDVLSAGHKDDIGINVQECVASPFSTLLQAQSNSVPLIQDSCPASNDVQLVTIYPEDIQRVRFSFKVVSFPDLQNQPGDFGLVFVHCRVSVCPADKCSASNRTCPDPSAIRRVRRSAHDSVSTHQLSAGPFLVSEDKGGAFSSTTALAAVSMVVAAIATVVAMVAVVAWRRSRRDAIAQKC